MDYQKEELEDIIKEQEEIKAYKKKILETRKKITETLKNKRQKKVEQQKRKLKKTLKYSSIFLLFSFLLLEIEKNYNHSNIYINNSLIISENDEENLYKILSQEAGTPVVKDERVLALSAVIKNYNLTEEEKTTLYEFQNLIIENPYLNSEELYESLKKVKVKHKSQPIYRVLSEDKNYGSYNFTNHTIKMFITNSDESFQETLEHEFIHCIYYKEETKMLPEYLREGMTELLTNEYFSETPYYEDESYCYEIIAVKQLCNMIDPDKVLEAFSTGKMNIISQELSRTMPEEESIQFLKDLEVTFFHHNRNHSVADKEYYINMRNFLLNFDKKRYSDSLANDTYDELLKDKLEESNYNIELLKLIGKENSYYEYLNYIAENGIYLKPFFSEKLKDNFDETKTNKSYIIVK